MSLRTCSTPLGTVPMVTQSCAKSVLGRSEALAGHGAALRLLPPRPALERGAGYPLTAYVQKSSNFYAYVDAIKDIVCHWLTEEGSAQSRHAGSRGQGASGRG